MPMYCTYKLMVQGERTPIQQVPLIFITVHVRIIVQGGTFSEFQQECIMQNNNAYDGILHQQKLAHYMCRYLEMLDFQDCGQACWHLISDQFCGMSVCDRPT